MKAILIASLLLVNSALFGQQSTPSKEFKAGISGTINFGNDLFGTGFGLNVQTGRMAYTLYLFDATGGFSAFDTRPNIMLSNNQIGVLAGYDFSKSSAVSLTAQVGVCTGNGVWRGRAMNQDEIDSYNGLYPGPAPKYGEADAYSYIGIPGSLSISWYFSSFMGLKLTANGVIQRHPDYSFGLGLVLGYFK